jgi:hypothetical protein
MINFGKPVSRRGFVAGTGALITLPLLGAAGSLSSTANAASRPPRVGFVYVPHGMVMTDQVDWWTPQTVGRDFAFTRTLAPLERHRDKVTVISNLAGADGAGQHTGAATVWLTDSFPKEGLDVEAGVSIDQLIAQNIGKQTPIPSLQVGIEDISSLKGFYHTGYSCTYLSTISWASACEPLAMETSPRAIFEKMYANGATSAQRAGRIAKGRSVLDAVLRDSQRLTGSLAASDRAIVKEYLDNVRSAEQRIEAAERAAGETGATPKAYSEHVALMFDLMHLAFQSDMSRVFTFMMARELSHLSYPEIGIAEPHHALSHHQNSPDTMAKLGEINRYHVELFSKFVDKLAQTPDGEGSLLDHTVLMYGSGMSNGNDHVKSHLPVALVGGLVRGNRHIRMAEGTPVGNLHVDIARQVGLELTSFGQRSSGETVGLS